MEIAYRQTISVVGIVTRTKNVDEDNPGTSKILPLWQHFYQNLYPQHLSGDCIYGVYSNYELNGANGFDVTAGGYDVMAAVEDCAGNYAVGLAAQRIELGAGKYLLFTDQAGEGNPVLQLWRQAWGHFGQPDCPLQREYKTDYEIYHPEGKIELFIGIQ
jgi:hypothetical protein